LVRCYIRKDTAGFSKKNYPSYEVHLTRNDRFIMLGRKMKIQPPNKFIITMDKHEINKNEFEYLGKVTSDTTTTLSNAYGRCKGVSNEHVHNKYASIAYSRKHYEFKDISVLIPKLSTDDMACEWQSMDVLKCVIVENEA
jgi:hypothetical protein